jgi:hypothetical protein
VPSLLLDPSNIGLIVSGLTYYSGGWVYYVDVWDVGIGNSCETTKYCCG